MQNITNRNEITVSKTTSNSLWLGVGVFPGHGIDVHILDEAGVK